MKRNLFALLSLFILASMILAACGGGAATEAPAPDEPAAPAATDAPMADFEGKSLMAADCDSTGIIKGVEATGEHEVTFTLCQPDPAFLAKIAFSVYGIYPEEWLEATAGDEGRTSEGLENPIGTGPYMVSEWNRGESITFTANPNYWGDAPEAETLVFRWSTESAARLLELQSGTIDGIDNVGPTDFDVVASDSNLSLNERPALNVFYIAFTNTFAPLDNQDVRQAIAKGIDRQRIVDTFYPPGSEVASHFTPCAIANACTGDEWYEFDVEAAREQLAAAGFPDGFQTKLYYRDVVRGYLPQVSNVAQDIQAQLKENLNIDAEIVVMESGAFIEESSAGRLDGLYLLGWGADYPHITNFLDYHFSESNPQFGIQSPTYFEKIAEGAQIADPADSESLYVDANNAIREYVPMIPVAHGGSGTPYRNDVTNQQASPLSNEYLL
jgi:peptide/nickel transport system substrate-binding protein